MCESGSYKKAHALHLGDESLKSLSIHSSSSVLHALLLLMKLGHLSSYIQFSETTSLSWINVFITGACDRGLLTWQSAPARTPRVASYPLDSAGNTDLTSTLCFRSAQGREHLLDPVMIKWIPPLHLGTVQSLGPRGATAPEGGGIEHPG